MERKFIGVWATPEMWERMRQQAHHERRTKKAIMVRALEEYFERNPLAITEVPSKVLDQPYESLGYLSVRSRNVLFKLGVKTIRDVCNLSQMEILAQRNTGMTTVNDIKRKLKEKGLSLKDKP